MKTLFERNMDVNNIITEKNSLPGTWFYPTQNGQFKPGFPGYVQILKHYDRPLYKVMIWDRDDSMRFGNSHLDTKILDRMFPSGWDHFISGTIE